MVELLAIACAIVIVGVPVAYGMALLEAWIRSILK